MRILITGAAGFIGGNFFRMFRDIYDCQIVDRRMSSVIGHMVVDLSRHVLDLSGYDVVVNFAAETFVDYSISDPRRFMDNNILSTFNLLEAARKVKLKRFIHVSTDEVYGSINHGFHKEAAALLPGNPYAASKAAADMFCLSYSNTYGLPVTIVRPENNYGFYQGQEKFIPKVIKSMLNNKDVILYGDGYHRRMWLHVNDTCQAIKHIIEIENPQTIYNIGSLQERRNIDIVKAIGNMLGISYNIKYVDDTLARPGHDRRYAIDTDKLTSLGWKPEYKLEEALRDVVSWYKENQWWFK